VKPLRLPLRKAKQFRQIVHRFTGIAVNSAANAFELWSLPHRLANVTIQSMQKVMNTVFIQLVAAAFILLSQAAAQDAPAAKPAQTGSAQSKGAASTTRKSSTAAKPATGLALKTQKEKESYALGMNIGMGLKRQPISVDPAVVARGLRDALGASKTMLTEDEMKAALQQLRADVEKQQQDRAGTEGAANRKEGDAFLVANKSKAGVQTLPDGLEYKILKEGTGPKPTANDTVTVNYRGTLINGKEFDSSYKSGRPASFPVGGLIKGWTEALQLMPVGSKWQLFIPPDLAYGDRGSGPDIGPGETLIFEVELLSIDKK
jgi:FKBP-type peptidyl-prolyl cis-trans isomerase FklB